MVASRLRTNIDTAIPPVDNDGQFEMDTFYEKEARDNSNIYERASANTEDAQRRMKRYYDRGTGFPKLTSDIGYWSRMSPWRVVERRDGNVHLSNQSSVKTRVIHIN